MKSPKVNQAESSPILSKQSDKQGRTSLDFFSIPKQDFIKTRLSVNMFQLKVKQPSSNNTNLSHQPLKKVHFQNLSKNVCNTNQCKNNFMMDLKGENQQIYQNKDFLPILDRNNEMNSYKSPQISVNLHRKFANSLQKNGKSMSEDKKSIKRQSKQKKEQNKMKIVPLEEELFKWKGNGQQKKNYFINNLSLDPNMTRKQSNRQQKLKNSPNFKDLVDEVEAWKKFVSQQSTTQKCKKKQDKVNTLDVNSKIKKLQSLPQIPDPLKTYRLSLNPEELSAKIRKKFKVNLIRRKKQDEVNMIRQNSGIEGWDTLQEDNQYPNCL